MPVGETSWVVETHGMPFDHRSGFGPFDGSAGLLDASDCELTRQSETPDFFVDEGVQSYVVPYSFFPSNINTELQCFAINSYGFRDSVIVWNLNIDRRSAQHNIIIFEGALKQLSVRSSDRIFQFLPPVNGVDVLGAV
ncbi:MAG: hypothetical protein HYS53_02805 [Candidatus Aenigmarchaeota archaeon]|nr:hypothetical protein [Candidatus Aenigmarchaeota archaeon]